MLHLKTEDQQQLVAVLKDVPELASEQSRRQILELAGLKKLVSMIDVAGSQFIAVNQIVSYLISYGRLSYHQEALGLFLNVVKSVTGSEQQAFLDKLLNEYRMMTPIRVSPHPVDWLGQETSSDIYEKVIGENTLRPVAFLAQGLQVAKSVAFIGVHRAIEAWSGTGFLVSPNLMLTNNHVLPSKDYLSDVVFRFNYEDNFKGEAQIPRDYRATLNDGIFYSNKDLDYTIVQIEGVPGTEWGWLSMPNGQIKYDERVNIIQHPYGQPKQISLQNNFVSYVGGNVVQYVTSTAQGSSGSPVLNDKWEVVALHHAGGNIPEPTTNRRFYRNEGILIEKIMNDLPKEIQKTLLEKTD